MKGKIRVMQNDPEVDYEALGMDIPDYFEDYFFDPEKVDGMAGTPDNEDIILHLNGKELSIVFDKRIYDILRKRLEFK
jgi:hypothetical protein